MAQNKSERERFDIAWKWAIEYAPILFVEFFLPILSDEIDRSRKIEFLNNVLKTIVKDSETGDRRADELLKVPLKNGGDMWILVHIEVQNYPDPDFAKRMFSYYYRIYDKYDIDVVSLAVLTDLNENFRPNEYNRKLYNTELLFKFDMVKLIDYSEAELLESDNPFAMVVLVHLEAMRAGNNDNKKFDVKVRLTQLLKEQGYSSQYIKLLFIFMDTEIRLPKDLEIKYEEEIGETVMEHIVTSWEQRGIEQGMQKGMQQGMQKGMQQGMQKLYQATKRMIRKNMDISLISEITGLTEKEIIDIKNGKTPKQVGV